MRANGLCNITQATSLKACVKSNSCDLLSDTFYEFVDMTLISKFLVMEHLLQSLIGCLPCKEKKIISAPYSGP